MKKILAVLLAVLLIGSVAFAATTYKAAVQDITNLPTTGASAGDVRVVTSLAQSFTYNSSGFWYPSDLVAPTTAPTYKAGVMDVSNLPSVNNTTGDVRPVYLPRPGLYRYGTSGWELLANTPYIHRVTKEAAATMSGGTTNIAVQVPSGAVLVAAQLRVDTIITNGTGGTTWAAAYNTGSVQTIATGQALAANTKVNKAFDANAATPITSGATDITITASAGSMTGGVVRAWVTYDVMDTLPNKS